MRVAARQYLGVATISVFGLLVGYWLVAPVGMKASMSTGVQVREVEAFADLQSMAQAADSVILAEVQSVEPGRSVGDDRDVVEFTEIRLTVIERLAGKQVDSASVLEVDELFTSRAATVGPNWISPGSRVVVFLHRKADEGANGAYRPISTQGLYLVSGDELWPSHPSPLGDHVSGLSLAQLRDRLGS